VLNRRLTSALIVALIISGIFTYWLSQKYAKKGTAAAVAKSQYVGAAANLEAGQVIKAENLRMVDWPANTPLPGAFPAPQPVVGRVVLYPLSAGEPILERQLASAGSGLGLAVKIPEGMRAISLRSDEVVGVAGFLLPGTHLDVLVTMRPPNSDPITTTVLQDVQVLASGQKTEPDPEGKPVTATVVTILVKPDEAERVDLASTQGTVHFILRNSADREQHTPVPVQFAELAGVLPKPAGGGSARRVEHVEVKKPYVVETFLGAAAKTESFQ
jgi:pilus assembly protein CpaB